MTTLYYALGGGLGHVTRARWMLGALGIERDAVILSSQMVADREDINPMIDRISPDRIIVDTFPAGLFGELGGRRVDYVARYLRWDRYLQSVRSIDTQIETAYVIEELDSAHGNWLRNQAGRLLSVAPPSPAAMAAADHGATLHVLVIHSGPVEEIDELIAYARDVCAAERIALPLTLCAPARMHRSGIHCVDAHPATELATSAALIFTGGGFNAMREFGGDPRHRPLAFDRKFDDQYRRIALTRRASAAATA